MVDGFFLMFIFFCLPQELPKRELKPGKNLEVIISDHGLLDMGYISCTKTEWLDELDDLSDRLKRYGATLPEQTYTPRVGEVCLAWLPHMNRTWFRGICLERVGDSFPLIDFVDHGNVNPISNTNLRRMPREFVKTAPCIVNCALEGYPEEITSFQLNELQKMLPIKSTIACDEVKMVFDADDKTEIGIVIVMNKISAIFEEKAEM